MSDTQDELILQQRRVQQRQILAMMGVEQWVQPNSATLNIADILSETVERPTSSEVNIDQLSPAPVDVSGIEAGIQEAGTQVDRQPAIADYNVSHDDSHDVGWNVTGEQSPVTNQSVDNLMAAPTVSSASNVHNAHTDSQVEMPPTLDPAVAPLVEPIIKAVTAPITQNYIAGSNSDNSLSKVAPFDLQGGRYGNWVVMVDIQALNNDSQKLWQNITQALSVTCETTSFPICEGMDTVELANASLAGYIFKIGRSEDINVAALTVLPEGLTHPNTTTVPTLDEMLEDSSLKRQLWEQLSGQ